MEDKLNNLLIAWCLLPGTPARYRYAALFPSQMISRWCIRGLRVNRRSPKEGFMLLQFRRWCVRRRAMASVRFHTVLFLLQMPHQTKL